jgi:asparagine synthase (glutamine-hydrolysing)
MCGIAGASWTADTEPLSITELERMIGVLDHRGPDDCGVYHSVAEICRTTCAKGNSERARTGNLGPGATLGHRRLSIIDLQSGHQPLANEDESIWIAFNGEIYNYRELRPPLEAQGHHFRTSSDTETIVHLYEEYGTDCVSHLRGMFAFAIWDANRQRLFLARDRLGQKPLFYRLTEGQLWFASELKALLQVRNAPRDLDPQALDEYLLYQYVPHPNCILRGYNKLPPAHWAVFEDGRFRSERYWIPPYAELDQTTSAERTVEDWRADLRQTLTEAVRLRMRSDVPLGTFLSGGIDSTIIAGLMQQLSDRPIQTFSIGFPVRQFDERTYARQAAQHLGTEHHESIVEPAALAILPRLIWHYDEPFADSSAIPTMYLSEMTRRHVTVSLSGDGGDELFAGYDRYKAVRLGAIFDRLPRPLRSILTARLWQRLPASVAQKSHRRRLKRLLSALGEEPRRRYLKWIGIFDDERRRGLYTDDFASALNGHDAAEFLLDAYKICPERDFVTRTTCTDALTYLPCDILTKVDIASMAFSLECRSPFLDHHVAELAARMPIELKQSGRIGKRILIDTFSDLLPTDIQRRRKMGFGVPLDHWFRAELKPLLHDLLLDRRSLDRGYFEPKAVRQLVEEHVSARWDHSYRLWSLLCLEAWHRMFLDVDSPPMEAPATI